MLYSFVRAFQPRRDYEIDMDRKTRLSLSRAETPADIVFTHCQIVNVYSGETEFSDIAVTDGIIVGIGKGYTGKQTIDLAGQYVAPGLIDAHVHIESSLCIPPEFARAVVPRGVTTVVVDPHEIANVSGVDGIRYMHRTSQGLALKVVIMAPSCVPATHMASSGASLSAADLAPLLADGTVYGLAEVMNFPGVIYNDDGVHAKIDAFKGTPIDGHAPGVLGSALNAYVMSGIGSDHECTTVSEAKEKLSRGLYILIREATNARNLQTLLPLITKNNARRICFCTDDRTAADLLDVGSVDYMIRQAIAYGIDPIDAFRMATLNTAEWFGLKDRGAIAPGKVADFFVFKDLKNPVATDVYTAGRRYTPADVTAPIAIPFSVQGRVSVDPLSVDFKIHAKTSRIRVIGSLADQLVTTERIEDATIVNGCAVSDTSRDILKMAVIERHHGTKRVGLGFIHGFGLTQGAIAGTIAHDHHNLVVIGCDDDSMKRATIACAESGAGCSVCDARGRTTVLPLPVAGLMSDWPIEKVRQQYDELLRITRDLGAAFHDPFMAMSFMALEVIPKLKLTDQGLVDVEQFKIVDLFV